jgi:HEAT repeat protein
LLRAAARKEPRVATTALQALRTLARKKPEAVRPLAGETDPNGPEAPIACALLAVVGSADQVSWLSRAVSAESPRTRRAAVEALGAIGGETAARSIALAVTDEVADVALAAIRALGRTRDASGVESPGIPALLRLLGSTDDAALVTAAVRAIGASGSSAVAASLRPLVTSDVPAVACAALEALTDLGVDDLPELVFSALSHTSSVVVRAALDAVDAIVSPASPHARFRSNEDREELSPRLIAEVSTALGHPSWEVRRRAAELLPRLAVGAWASQVRPLLAERVAGEPEPAVREAIDRAIVEIEARLGLRTVPPPSGSESEGGL